MSLHFRMTINKQFFVNHLSPSIFITGNYGIFIYLIARPNCTIFIYGIHKMRDYFRLGLLLFYWQRNGELFVLSVRSNPLEDQKKDVANLFDYILQMTLPFANRHFSLKTFFVCFDLVRLFTDKELLSQGHPFPPRRSLIFYDQPYILVLVLVISCWFKFQVVWEKANTISLKIDCAAYFRKV